MEMTLRASGIDIWKSVVTGYTAPKLVKTITQKDARKNNSMAIELILEGLTDSIKGRIGNYSSAKELWVLLEQLCSEGDTKGNSNSAKKSSSEYYGSNDVSVSKSSSKVDHCNHGDEDEDDVDLAVALDEISFLHKLIEKQTKKISSLQSQLEKSESKEEKDILDEENDDAKADLEVALLEIRGLSDFIKKQEMESSSQLEEAKNKEGELLRSLQAKEQELTQAKEEITKAQKLVKISTWNSSLNTDTPVTNEAEKLAQLEYALITALEEIKNGQTSDWDIELSREALDNLEDIIMYIIKHSEIILKKNILLQKGESKHEESSQDESASVLVETLRAKEEENRKLKAQMVDLTEAQKDLSKTVMNLKVQTEEAKRIGEVLRNQLVEKENSCHKMETEIMDLRRKATTHNRIIDSSAKLNEILDSQKSSNDKSGLGYNKVKEPSGSGKGTLEYKTPLFVKEKVKELFSNVAEDGCQQKSSSCQDPLEEDVTLKWKHGTEDKIYGADQEHTLIDDQKKEALSDRTSARKNQTFRYEHPFNGYCFSCYDFGHKAFQCKRYYQKGLGGSNHLVRCWKCNFDGHTAMYCHTIKCYNCDGFGHKAKECWYSQKHIMKHTFYSPVIQTRRDGGMKTPWKLSEGQFYAPKGTNMRRVSPEFAKIWRKKTYCKQSEKTDTEESKYFSTTEEDSANTKSSDFDNTEILREEARKKESLMEEECDWAL